MSNLTISIIEKNYLESRIQARYAAIAQLGYASAVSMQGNSPI